MKKKYLLTLVLLLGVSACKSEDTSSSNNSLSYTSSSNGVISSSSNSSSTTLTSTSSSTSSSSSSTSVDKFITVANKDLECVLNETQDGFIIYRYLKYDSYIRLPETFTGLFEYKTTFTDRENYDVYSGTKIYDSDAITLPIVGIMDNAFRSSGGVKDVYFPNSYTDFTPKAFSGCTTIINYLVDDNHPIFESIDGVLYTKDNSSLFTYPTGRKDTYEVVAGTKKILSNAFYASNVVEVNLPESVEEIEESAFNSAKRLRRINIPAKVKEIKQDTFHTCSDLKYVTFSEGLEKINYNAFWQCDKIKELKFPSTLREIGTSAFEGVGSYADGIKNLVFNEGLETIGDFAFAYNEYIETISFPSTLKTIGKYAFMQNYSMKELTLNEGLVELQEGAFFYNLNLQNVTLPSTLQSIGFDCFTTSEVNAICDGIEEYILNGTSNYFKVVDGVVYSKDGKELIVAPMGRQFENNNYIVLDGVERINDHAFYNCKYLKSVVLPSSLKTIGKAPFYLTPLNRIEYLGDMESFKMIETTDEVFTSDTSSDQLIVKWFFTSEYFYISTVNCSDGDLSLI